MDHAHHRQVLNQSRLDSAINRCVASAMITQTEVFS